MFKVGDMVRVVSGCPSNWDYWVGDMDKFINDGKTYPVIKVDHDGDVKLDHGDESWLYPARSLQLASDGLLSDIKITGYVGYAWNGNTYSSKTSLLRAITKQRYNDFMATNCDVKFIDQLIDQLKEVKEVCQKLS